MIETVYEIPKIIFQTWKNKNISSTKFNKYHLTWKKYFPEPEYEHVLFDDDDIENFVKNEYPQYLELFNSMDRIIYKVDFIRYLFLHKHGGIYVGLDYEAYGNFYSLLQNKPVWIAGSNHYLDKGAQNSLMASVPNHPFWIAVADEIELRFKNRPVRNIMDVIILTGPAVLVVREKFPDVGILRTGLFDSSSPKSYSKHHNTATWLVKDNFFTGEEISKYSFVIVIIVILFIILLIYGIFFNYKAIVFFSS